MKKSIGRIEEIMGDEDMVIDVVDTATSPHPGWDEPVPLGACLFVWDDLDRAVLVAACSSSSTGTPRDSP